MKILIKNTVMLFTRYTTATGLNVAGLTLAFASFMVIMMQVWYELRFDRCYPHAERIYTLYVSTSKPFEGMGTVLSRPQGEELIRSSPGIETGGCFSYAHSSLDLPLFLPEQGEDTVLATAQFSGVSRQFPEVFGFEIISGSLQGFCEPNAGIIPQSLAVKLFGHNNPIGQTIGYTETDKHNTPQYVNVAAVYKDFPKNASLKNDIYTDIGDQLLHTFDNRSTVYFVKVKQDADKHQIEEQLLPYVWSYAEQHEQDSTKTQRIELLHLNDLYFLNASLSDEGGNRNITYALLTVAVMILIIAAINFVNFAIAQAPLRMRSINTRKVFGCHTRQLRFNLIVEATGLTVLSFLLALCLVQSLSATRLSSMVIGGISLTAYPALTCLSAAIALTTGLVAGMYPAFYITSFEPAIVLKGSFAISQSGRKLRLGLISFQFIVSIILIIMAFSIHSQNSYLQKYDIGLPRENIVTVKLNWETSQQSAPLIHRLKQFPDITDITRSQSFVVGQGGTYINDTYKGHKIEFEYIRVDTNFVRFMGLKLIDGRDFEPSDAQNDNTVMIVNQTAQNSVDITVPDQFRHKIIIGVVEDYHTKPLHYPIAPTALAVGKFSYPMLCMYVKIANPDPGPAIAFIHNTFRSFNPLGETPEVPFMDQRVGALYQKEQHLAGLVSLFSLMSVLLSVVGVFGVIHFETARRRKEIALRKVYGSTTSQILRMFNRTYIRIVLICFAIAAPTGYYFVIRWLDHFAYKVHPSVWIFVAALMIVLVIVVATISLQSYKTANQNPVKSIRTE